MSTKYAVTICSTKDKASNILENFLDNTKKFDAIDIASGNKFMINYSKYTVNTINDIPIAKAKFLTNSYDIYLMSAFNEEANDLPRKVCYHQNMAEVAGVICIANGNINNKEAICRKYDLQLGQCVQEFLVYFFNYLASKPFNRNLIIENMVREIESELLSFVIYDKNKNEMYIYNRGDLLYMSNIPGDNITISSDILPIKPLYPEYSFYKLPSNTCLKIDTKTMYLNYLPLNCNIFSFGRDLMIDPNKALLFTENCDMEFYTAYSLLSSKDIINISDINVLFFGYDTDIDGVIFSRINKLKKELKISGKLPSHIKYNFDNPYSNESEMIDDLTKKLVEDSEEYEDGEKKTKLKTKKLTPPKNELILKDNTVLENKKLNFIASNIVSIALERGLGSIFIPNSNRKNNRLISIIRSLIRVQVNTPLYVYSLFDDFTTIDFIRFLVGCKSMTNLDSILINSDRNSIMLEMDDNGKPVLKYNIFSTYNNDVFYAFLKSGFENQFEQRYIGKQKINNQLINSGFNQDKIMDNRAKAEFLNMISQSIKNATEYQRKLQSF